MKFLKESQGFSLIELSIILTVIATLTMGYLQWTSAPLSTNADKTNSTLQSMDVIATAIADFVATKKRLPCPARYDVNETNTDFGEENLDTLVQGVYECDNVFGSIPTKALGISHGYMFDGWGRRFTYQVSNALCGQDTDLASIPVGQAIYVGCGIRDYREGLDINNPTENRKGDLHIKANLADADSEAITREAAFVILSHGANGDGAYLPSGEKKPDVKNFEEHENYDEDNVFIQQAISDGFDDLLLYRTKDQLENLSIDVVTPPVTLGECNANSTQIAAINIDSYNDLNSTVISMKVEDGADDYNLGGDAVLNMMWMLQLTCDTLYNGDVGWMGMQCPGGGTYDPVDEVCECDDGTWDDSC